MVSQKQITANQRNALKSTGPRTQGGKTRSRMNALRHGFASTTHGWPAMVERESNLDAIAAALTEIDFERARLFQKTEEALLQPELLQIETINKTVRRLAALQRYSEGGFLLLKKHTRKISTR